MNRWTYKNKWVKNYIYSWIKFDDRKKETKQSDSIQDLNG